MAFEKIAADAAALTKHNTQIFWLAAWLVNNVGITILNKHAFSRTPFHYPWVVSAFHMACNWLGTIVYFVVSKKERTVITGRQWLPLVIFSIVFSLNIAIGNISSMLVSVKFNQVMRSLVPAIVMVVGVHMFKKTYSTARKWAVLPIICGVALACYGEMTVNLISFMVTAFCVLLAALKVILSGEMLTGNMKMPPLHLLSRMAPLALVQMSIAALFKGEVQQIIDNWEEVSSGATLWVVFITGVGSFSLNLCSLQANKVTSPLTLSIMANIKQVLLIAFSALYFKDPATYLNVFGIAVVVVASFRYSLLSVQESNRQTKAIEDVESAGPLLPK